jgi:hypothetical protein
MPTPAALSSELAAAAIAEAEVSARAGHQECVDAESRAGGDHGQAGEGWTAAAWLTAQQVANVIARVLLQPISDLEGEVDLPGTSAYKGSVELTFFRTLGKAGSSKAALLALLTNGNVAEILADELAQKLSALANTGAATAGELHQKFVDEGAGFDLEYAGLKTFYSGLEAVVGAPSPQVLTGMQREHCNAEDSVIPFTTPNYRMSTTSRIEWWFVYDPTTGRKEMRLDEWPAEHPDTIKGSARPREAKPPSEFHEARQANNAKLRSMDAPTIMVEEFVGCRLYTGPCFTKYNTTLRGLQSSIPFFKKQFESLCKGNKYTTTLHVINSAIVKLSKLTYASAVYRGVAGGRLPAHFRVANEYGVRGGIDPAFMSTTTDRNVALTYASSSGGPGVVFSIQQGMVDRGADISWLSQYPHEKECAAQARPLPPHPPHTRLLRLRMSPRARCVLRLNLQIESDVSSRAVRLRLRRLSVGVCVLAGSCSHRSVVWRSSASVWRGRCSSRRCASRST